MPFLIFFVNFDAPLAGTIFWKFCVLHIKFCQNICICFVWWICLIVYQDFSKNKIAYCHRDLVTISKESVQTSKFCPKNTCTKHLSIRIEGQGQFFLNFVGASAPTLTRPLIEVRSTPKQWFFAEISSTKMSWLHSL